MLNFHPEARTSLAASIELLELYYTHLRNLDEALPLSLRPGHSPNSIHDIHELNGWLRARAQLLGEIASVHRMISLMGSSERAEDSTAIRPYRGRLAKRRRAAA